MITDADIKKIKRVVATKDDLKFFATKDDLKSMEDRQSKKFATKNDLKSMEDRFSKKFSTKGDIDDAVAQIATAVSKSLEDYATKDDVKKLAKAEDLKRVEDKVDDVASDVSDIRRRVIDLETDSVTRREFNDFKTKVLPA